MKPGKHLTHIEPLEARIAPAMILNPYTVTFQDSDGDTAVVKISKPLFTTAIKAGNILQFTNTSGTSIQESFTGNGTPENLNNINLLARTDAAGLDISVTVLPQVGVGDAHVNVGSISAANFSVDNQVSQNIDLGSIRIQGNLGSITAGASNYFFVPSIKSLTVDSMTTAAISDVLGPIGSLNVAGNFSTRFFVIGYQFGSISKLTIGGTMSGDSAGDAETGFISFTGTIGSATIGNLIGSGANLTGALVGSNADPSRIGSLTINGSGGIRGGAGQESGFVFAQAGIGKVNIVNSVNGITGGSGQSSGEISGPIGNVNITGNVVGGSGVQSGSIFSEFLSTTTTTPIALPIGNVTIGGNLQGGTAGSSGTAGDTGVISATSAHNITIGGSLIGGANQSSSFTADTSGVIMVNSVQNLIIVGNITGGSGPHSGLVTGQGEFNNMSYGNILVSGDVAGGSGVLSGAININGLLGGSISNLHIGGNVIGGAGTQSGYIQAFTKLGTLSIGGNVTGAAADNTGEIVTGGTLGNALIKGNLTGPASSSSTALFDTGYIEAKTITSLEIKGTVTAGANTGTGGLADSGAIRATNNIVALTIDGAVTGTASNPVIISAVQGPGTPTKTDLAIAKATFQSSVSYLDILAGYNTPSAPTAATAPLGNGVDPSAQIGTVTIVGNLSATNIVAGATGTSGTGYPPAGQFGTVADAAITASGFTGIHSTIAKIIIEGTAAGDSTSGDTFGFVAQQVVAVQVGSSAIPLTTGANNDHLVPVAGNLFVNEVAPPV